VRVGVNFNMRISERPSAEQQTMAGTCGEQQAVWMVRIVGEVRGEQDTFINWVWERRSEFLFLVLRS
jgi:hypothetical protein